MSDEWSSAATFVDAVLAARERPAGFVAAKFFQRTVFVAVVHYRSVVATENDQRVFLEPIFFQ